MRVTLVWSQTLTRSHALSSTLNMLTINGSRLESSLVRSRAVWTRCVLPTQKAGPVSKRLKLIWGNRSRTACEYCERKARIVCELNIFISLKLLDEPCCKGCFRNASFISLFLFVGTRFLIFVRKFLVILRTVYASSQKLERLLSGWELNCHPRLIGALGVGSEKSVEKTQVRYAYVHVIVAIVRQKKATLLCALNAWEELHGVSLS